MGIGWAITSTLVGGMASSEDWDTCSTGSSIRDPGSRPSGSSSGRQRDLHRVSAVRQGRRVTTTVEPERELVRRLLPFALPALAIAAGAGAAIGGVGGRLVGGDRDRRRHRELRRARRRRWPWAARISPMLVMAVGLGGYLVRIAAFTVALLLLDNLSWFSPLAFVAAFAPATVALLVVEMRLLSGRMQADLWYFPERPERIVIAAILAAGVPSAHDARTSCSTATSASICSGSSSASTSSSRWSRHRC